MTTRDDLQNAFLDCRRNAGIETARGIVNRFGKGDIDGIPEEQWPAAIQAFQSASGEPARTIESIDSAAIYARWNAKGRKPAAE